MPRALCLLVSLTAILYVALGASTPAGADEIRIGAGAAPSENVLKPVKAAFEKATGHKLTVISSGPKLALQDLLAGNLDAAAAGLTMENWLSLAKKEGVDVKNPDALQPVTIGKDRIAVLVHKSNPVSKLTQEQLKGLFSGTVGSWKEVGGPDIPVIVVWGKLIQGTNDTFGKAILGGAAFTKDVLEVNTAEEVRQGVAANPEAVGIGPVAVVNADVKSPETPEVGRPINLVTVGKPAAKVQALLDFIKGDGQKLVKQ